MVRLHNTEFEDYERENQTNLSDFGIIAFCKVEKTQTTLLDFPLEYDRPLNPLTQVFIDILRIGNAFEEKH
jgi:hypothetical protein